MTMPSGIRFLKSHEWARNDGESVSVGISEFAVEQLNREIVFVELPEVGRRLKQGDLFGVIESVKAASDLYAPLSGEVIEVNNSLVDNPVIVAEDPFVSGWMIKVRPDRPEELDVLLNADDYATHCQSEGAH